MFAIILSSCASLPEVNEKSLAKAGLELPAGLSLEGLASGRKLYVNKCSGCHFLHTPGEFTKAEWSEKIFPKMANEAKLSPEEGKSILNYLLLFASSAKSRR